MTDAFLKYRLPVVTAVLALAGLARALGVGDDVLPSDEQLTALIDSLSGAAASALWLWTFYHTDTSAGSFQENV